MSPPNKGFSNPSGSYVVFASSKMIKDEVDMCGDLQRSP